MMHPTAAPGRIALAPDWHSILDAMAALGRMQLWVGNAGASLVRWVRWEDVRVHAEHIDFVSGGVHARLDLTQVASVFATECAAPSATPLVLGIQCPDGATVLEFRFPSRVRQGFDTLIRAYRVHPVDHTLARRTRRPSSRPNDEIDVAALRAGWDRLGPACSMQALLAEHRIPFAQCCRLAGPGRVRRLSATMAHARLRAAEEQRLATLVRVHNPAASAAHIGPICATRSIGSMLHLYACCGFGASIALPHLASGWELFRPGVAAAVRSLEFVDADDERLLSIAFPGEAFIDYL